MIADTSKLVSCLSKCLSQQCLSHQCVSETASMDCCFVGEIMGTCLGMVGVVLLTRASKVDQQVGVSVHPAASRVLLFKQLLLTLLVYRYA